MQNTDMKKAMIFAAGTGSRLRPLTNQIPEALVPVAGVPLLERVICKLADAGFYDITINIHHLGQQIIDFLQAKQNFGLHIHISDERTQLLNTGGGIRHARHFLDGNEPFLVHNVDILTDANINVLWDSHIRNGAEATLLTEHRKTSRYLLFDSTMHLRGWFNQSTQEIRPAGLTNTYESWAFDGIHVFSPSLFRRMEDARWESSFSIIDFYLHVCADSFIQGCPIQATHWFDTGTPDTLAKAEIWYSNKK